MWPHKAKCEILARTSADQAVTLLFMRIGKGEGNRTPIFSFGD